MENRTESRMLQQYIILKSNLAILKSEKIDCQKLTRDKEGTLYIG